MVQVALVLKRRSAYDAAYLNLADDLGAELWTLDGPLARNASAHGYPIRLIESPEPASSEPGQPGRVQTKCKQAPHHPRPRRPPSRIQNLLLREVLSWLLDRDGEITITLPAGHVGPDDLRQALRPAA